jgi:hypothetical protein
VLESFLAAGDGLAFFVDGVDRHAGGFESDDVLLASVLLALQAVFEKGFVGGCGTVAAPGRREASREKQGGWEKTCGRGAAKWNGKAVFHGCLGIAYREAFGNRGGEGTLGICI